MIDALESVLVRLLTNQVPNLAASQIGFNAPDSTWRGLIPHASGSMLNVYLVELSENVELRSNERVQGPTAGGIERRRAPPRLNCRFLISAWSPASAHPLTDPASDEAVLLYQVTQVLMDAIPLDANTIFAPAGLPANFPTELVDPPLPAVVAPAEPFPTLADFWMRMDTVWKPVVDLIVTIPVTHYAVVAGPAVTTLFTEYGVDGHPPLEEVAAIGGVVRLTGTGLPVPGAWVRLVELDRTVTANVAGQFVFTGLERGAYTLETGTSGHATVSRPVDVPSLTGDYDLHLT